MDKANSFKLEIVRPGKRHGQLISKLTNYVVLCDGADSDTISLPFDHYELRSEIRALRYFVGGGESQRPIPSPTRQDAVRRLSERLETVIAQMRGFQTRISQTGCAEEMTHIRLILGGSELSLIPFELATAPAGWRGAGNKILLQTLSPMVFTREIRGSETFAVKWNQQPRVLVISASPDGYSPPPLKDHVAGIFRALRPMIKTPAKNEPADNYEQIVTVLENASLEAIEQEMAKGS